MPLGAALLLLMGVGPALPWGSATAEQMRRALLPPLLGAAVVTALGFAFGARHPWTLLTLAFAGYTLQVTLRELWLPVSQRMRAHGEGAGRAVAGALLRQGRRRLGGYIVHAGAVIVFSSIAVSSTMQVSKELQMNVGDSARIGPYTLTFLRIEELTEPHRQSVVARIAVSRGGDELGVLSPRMNQYENQREPIGTPAVRSFLAEDLYLSVMNIDASGGKVGLLALINPMVGWIWAATGMMALGGLIALVLPHREATVLARAVSPSAEYGAVTGTPR